MASSHHVRRISRAARRPAATLITLLLAAITALGPAPVASAADSNAARFVPNELLVRFAPEAGAAQRASALNEVNAGRGRSLQLPGLRLIEVDGISVLDAAAKLEHEPGVRYAEPNYVNGWDATPNDIYFVSQWALENTGQNVDSPPVSGTPDADIDAVAAWNTSTGSTKTIIGIADTGIFYNHPDLAGNIYINPGEFGGGKASNGVDDDGNGYVDDFRGYDFFDGDNDAAPSDPPAALDQHGTLVASTAGAQGNNSIGVTGVSQDVSLMPLRIGDGPSGPVTANQVLAFRYAGKLGADVVNLSGSGSGFSQSVLDAIRAAPNTLFVFAAGNGGADHIGDDNDSSPTYPCNLEEPNVVCLAATDQDDKLASFSNYGASSVDLAAPGVNILAATIGTDPASDYDFVDGTSFAAPITAGAAGVYRSHYPQATAAHTRRALRIGVDKLAPLSAAVEAGGRLNLDRTLDIMPPPPPAAPPPAAPPPPDTSITLSLAAKGKQKVKKLKVKVSCGSEACEAELRGKAVAKRKKKGGKKRKRASAAKKKKRKKTFKVKPKTFSVPAGGQETERVRFKKKKAVKKLRRLLRRKAYRRGGTKAKLNVTVADAAGNEASGQETVKLKR